MEAKTIERGMRQPRYRRTIMCVSRYVDQQAGSTTTSALTEHRSSHNHHNHYHRRRRRHQCVYMCAWCMRACLPVCVRASVRVCNVCVWTMPKAPLRSVVSVV